MKSLSSKAAYTAGLESRLLVYDHRLWSGVEKCLHLLCVDRRELQAESWDRGLSPFPPPLMFSSAS